MTTTFTEITRPRDTRLRSAPVFVQEVLQPTLHNLTAPLECYVNGVAVRVPAGVTLAVLGGGGGGHFGRTTCHFLVDGLDGETYQGHPGMEVSIPHPE